MTTKQKELPNVSKKNSPTPKHVLFLHNDDVNTFEHVIDTLIEVCRHEPHQAEQCALITHYKGKCDVKHGVLNELESLMNELHKRGLSATINPN